MAKSVKKAAPKKAAPKKAAKKAASNIITERIKFFMQLFLVDTI